MKSGGLTFYSSIVKLVLKEPKWRNWETRRTQNPLGIIPHEGSTPSFGILLFVP